MPHIPGKKRTKKGEEVPAGTRIWRWTVIKEIDNPSGARSLLCKCECGTEKVVNINRLRQNRSKSCGCYRTEMLPTHRFIHGGSRLNRIFRHINQRCNNPNNKKYHRYGGRGISICEEWKNNFKAFETWALENGYAENLSIDRKDNDGNYEPSNCRWSTNLVQCRNKGNNVFIEFNGTSLTISEWAERMNLSYALVQGRIYKGWSVERALTLPARRVTNIRKSA